MALIHIKELTRAVDTKNRSWYSELESKQKKEFSAWMTMRIISSCANDNNHRLSLVLTNEIVNINFNNFKDHPELIWKLLTCVDTGKIVYHPWISPYKKKKTNYVLEWLEKNFKFAKIKDLEVLEQLLDKREIIEYAEQQGCTDKQIKDLKKLLK